MSEAIERPDRPVIPGIAYALVAVLVVERSIMGEGKPWLDGNAGKCAVGLAIVLVAIAVFCSIRRHDASALHWLLAVAVSASFVVTSATLARGAWFCDSMATSAVSTCTFEIVSDMRESTGGYRGRARATCESGAVGDVWITLSSRLERGTTLSCVGRYATNGDDEWGTSSRMQGVWGSVRGIRLTSQTEGGGILREVWKARSCALGAIDARAGEARALLAGSVCGSREGLVKYGLDDLFSRCGVAHLVAVSGGHLSLLMGMLATMLGSVRMRPKRRMLLTALTCGLFVVFCGIPVSAVRAWLMAMAAMLGKSLGRRSHMLSAVCVVGTLMALVDPTLSGQFGFVLSVATVCGLGAFSAYAEYVLHVLVGKIRLPRFVGGSTARRIEYGARGLRACVATTLVAQVATLPFMAESFGEVSLVAPLANLVVSVPFAAFVSVGFLAVAGSSVPVAGNLLLRLIDVLGAFVIAPLRLVSRIPMATVRTSTSSVTIAICVCVAIVGLLVVWPRVRRGVLLVALALLVSVSMAGFAYWRLFAPARVCVLDVGQGDAILVQDGPHALLVDAGPDEAIVDALDRKHVTHLDAVLLTHLHEDHYAGIEHLVNRVECSEVLVGNGVSGNLPSTVADAVGEMTGGSASEVGYGDVIVIGGFRLRVVSPEGTNAGTENADSIELAVTYEREGSCFKALLTGDAESGETGAAIARGDVGDIDMLKVGHHGSEISITPEQAKALDPEVSVASAGENNRYGHPTAECVRALEDADSWFLCTKDSGDVEVRPSRNGQEVMVARP